MRIDEFMHIALALKSGRQIQYEHKDKWVDWEEGEEELPNFSTRERWRVAPIQRIPLQLEDFPVGSQIKSTQSKNSQQLVLGYGFGNVLTTHRGYSLRELACEDDEKWLRSIDGGKTWLECYKEVQHNTEETIP